MRWHRSAKVSRSQERLGFNFDASLFFQSEMRISCELPAPGHLPEVVGFPIMSLLEASG